MTKSLARALARDPCQCGLSGAHREPMDPVKGIDVCIESMVETVRFRMLDDIADAVLFLALGTSTATGQWVSIDGGQTLG